MDVIQPSPSIVQLHKINDWLQPSHRFSIKIDSSETSLLLGLNCSQIDSKWLTWLSKLSLASVCYILPESIHCKKDSNIKKLPELIVIITPGHSWGGRHFWSSKRREGSTLPSTFHRRINITQYPIWEDWIASHLKKKIWRLDDYWWPGANDQAMDLFFAVTDHPKSLEACWKHQIVC